MPRKKPGTPDTTADHPALVSHVEETAAEYAARKAARRAEKDQRRQERADG